MRSICKNCHFAKPDKERLVCERNLKYVLPEHRCKRWVLAEDKGDLDKPLFVSLAVIIATAVILGLVYAL